MAEMFKGWKRVMGAVAIMSLILGCDQQTTSSSNTGGNGTAPASTVAGDAIESAEFIRMAAMNCRLALQSSELVLEKNVTGDERDFAEMARAHSPQMLTSLQAIAEQNDIPLPADLDDEHQARLDQLRTLDGGALADAYHDLQAEIHRDLVQLLTNASQNLHDPALRDWAAQHRSQAQAHLKALAEHDHDHGHAH